VSGGNDSRNRDHRPSCGIAAWKFENAADDKQAGYHGRAAPDKQRATTDFLSGPEAQRNECAQDRVDGHRGNEGLSNAGLLEEVRGVREQSGRAIPQLVVERYDRDDGPALSGFRGVMMICLRWTYEVGASEAVQNGDSGLLGGKNTTVFDLLKDDSIFVFEVVVRHGAVDLEQDLLGHLVVAFEGIETRRLGDEEQDNDRESNEDPLTVNRIPPLVGWEGGHNLECNSGAERSQSPLFRGKHLTQVSGTVPAVVNARRAGRSRVLHLEHV
jgi:hypothetical protein